ncbi:MAG: Asp-tRNA(Asn)/Glu-tRNA(Gln) amidotransferase subunit GatC [Victivallaceae bacterium]
MCSAKSENAIDVKYVAQLARIDIDPAQQSALQHDMESIVSYIETLAELDVSGIEPTAHAALLSNVWREDAASCAYTREAMLRNAPDTVNQETIKVPQVLPGEGMN